MIIIVDGYNVLKQLSSKLESNESERRAFAIKLGRYAKRKEHKIILVFDGGSSSWPIKEKIHGVELVYSGFKETADDFIIDYIERHKKGQMLLVSSDRQLCLIAQDMGVISINALDFYSLLASSETYEVEEKKNGRLVKTSTIDHPELDSLMEHATVNVPYKQADKDEKEREQKKQRLSKEERALMRKIKKL